MSALMPRVFQFQTVRGSTPSAFAKATWEPSFSANQSMRSRSVMAGSIVHDTWTLQPECGRCLVFMPWIAIGMAHQSIDPKLQAGIAARLREAHAAVKKSQADVARKLKIG